MYLCAFSVFNSQAMMAEQPRTRVASDHILAQSDRDHYDDHNDHDFCIVVYHDTLWVTRSSLSTFILSCACALPLSCAFMHYLFKQSLQPLHPKSQQRLAPAYHFLAFPPWWQVPRLALVHNIKISPLFPFSAVQLAYPLLTIPLATPLTHF